MSTMDAIGVRIPEKQKKKLESKVEEKGYPNVSEYIRELIRDDLEEEELKEEVAREIMRRRKEVEARDTEFDEMRTMEEIAEEEGLKE